MASATPDLRLPSQSQDIAAPQLVPNYTAWWQKHTCNNLPKVVTWQRLGRELNSRPLESQANALSITPPGHSLPFQAWRIKHTSTILPACVVWTSR